MLDRGAFGQKLYLANQIDRSIDRVKCQSWRSQPERDHSRPVSCDRGVYSCIVATQKNTFCCSTSSGYWKKGPNWQSGSLNVTMRLGLSANDSRLHAWAWILRPPSSLPFYLRMSKCGTWWGQDGSSLGARRLQMSPLHHDKSDDSNSDPIKKTSQFNDICTESTYSSLQPLNLQRQDEVAGSVAWPLSPAAAIHNHGPFPNTPQSLSKPPQSGRETGTGRGRGGLHVHVRVTGAATYLRSKRTLGAV